MAREHPMVFQSPDEFGDISCLGTENPCLVKGCAKVQQFTHLAVPQTRGGFMKPKGTPKTRGEFGF